MLRRTLLAIALVSPVCALASPALAAPASSCAPTTYQRGMNLPASSLDQAALDALASQMIAPQEDAPSSPDPEENRRIAAAWTYFGQFVDHDITLDNAPDDLVTPRDPSTVTNSRTQWLDLDNVYGQGPVSSPTLYQADGVHLVEGRLVSGGTSGFRDLPRTSSGRALLGDARDDENRMVAGIHASFLSLHNRYVDALKTSAPDMAPAELFREARSRTVASYQSILVSEYLPRITDPAVYASYVSQTPSGFTARTRGLFDICRGLPVEFSVASYRFGHSQVRAFYRLNNASPDLPVFDAAFDSSKMVGGFSPLAEGSAIDWSLFINTRAPKTPPASPISEITSDTASDSVQWSYKIDPSITYSLSLLPLPATGLGPANLARRNLLRSSQLSLPSGESVARALGLTPLTPDQIRTGAAVPGTHQRLVDISSSFENNTPLWVYTLAESAALSRGAHLGPVGSTIVAETFVSLLLADSTSVLTTPAPRAHLRDVLTSAPLRLDPPRKPSAPATPPAKAVRPPARPSSPTSARPAPPTTTASKPASSKPAASNPASSKSTASNPVSSSLTPPKPSALKGSTVKPSSRKSTRVTTLASARSKTRKP